MSSMLHLSHIRGAMTLLHMFAWLYTSSLVLNTALHFGQSISCSFSIWFSRSVLLLKETEHALHLWVSSTSSTSITTSFGLILPHGFLACSLASYKVLNLAVHISHVNVYECCLSMCFLILFSSSNVSGQYSHFFPFPCTCFICFFNILPSLETNLHFSHFWLAISGSLDNSSNASSLIFCVVTVALREEISSASDSAAPCQFSLFFSNSFCRAFTVFLSPLFARSPAFNKLVVFTTIASYFSCCFLSKLLWNSASLLAGWLGGRDSLLRELANSLVNT